MRARDKPCPFLRVAQKCGAERGKLFAGQFRQLRRHMVAAR